MLQHRISNLFCRFLDVLAGLVGCLVLLIIGPLILIGGLFRGGPVGFEPVSYVGLNRRHGAGFTPAGPENRRRIVMPGRMIHAWRFAVPDRQGELEDPVGFSLPDVLPLSWNLLRGDLTLFGPRPLPLETFLVLKGKFPDETFAPGVKPGLMGLAQLDEDREKVPGAWRRRLELDRRYVARRTLVLDLQILLFSLLELVPRFRT